MAGATSESGDQGAFGEIYRRRLAEAEQQIASRLGIGQGASPFRSLRRRIVIGHAPRVGSHLLCEQLTAYGARVQEFFEAPRIHATAARESLADLKGYCRWLIRAHAANGIFGVSGGVKILAPLMLVGELPDFVADWSFVFLRREDVVAQAVSWLVMRLSGAFRSSASPRRSVSEADYDAGQLKGLIDAAMSVNAAWEGAFRALGVTPLRLTYEALSANPEAAAARVAQGLDLVPARVHAGVGPRPVRQATELNAVWIARFRSEQADFCRSRAEGEFGVRDGEAPPPGGVGRMIPRRGGGACLDNRPGSSL